MSNMTDRDRKILLAVIPVVVLVAYYFLLFTPKREEASKAAKDLTAQQKRVTDAQARVTQAQQSKTTFAADYTQMVRLGKAIPSKVDMPSLLVQLEQASNGTGIRFTKIATGERDQGATPPAATDKSQSSGGTGGNGTNGASGQPAAAAGGEQAGTSFGKSAEKANNTAASENKNAADANSNANANSSGSGTGGAPSDTGGQSSTPTSGSTPPAGLETTPLDLEFDGNFFNLANFFHRLKRLVYLKGDNVAVSGRLVTIDSIKYESDPELFPKIKATLTATIYLSPQSEGTTAGATPEGPDASQGTPASAPGGSSSAPPAATASPVGANR
jgi:Pilus assembly protein, PilO